MIKAREAETPFHGEETCSQKDCTLAAYYRPKSLLKNSLVPVFCGRHSDKKNRVALKKNPNAAKIQAEKLQAHAQSIVDVGNQNKKQDIRGTVSCHKMQMMKPVPLENGVLLVFPNNRHQDRSDGFGCCSLSPMRLGPVIHGQPGLPDAMSIENYHQFNKCFSFEQSEGQPLEIFYEKRNEAYLDAVPHRHKYDATKIKKMNKDYVNGVNVPMYSVHMDRDGKERHYSYLESRFFYCFWYERLAKQTQDFAILKQKLQDGVNLCICGYDAFQPTSDLYTHYCDASRPFGHELVLYSLLTIEDEAEYPWTKFYREHCDLYDPLSFS